jgi:hypothetical protein
MGAGAYALVRWFDFTLRNPPDALDYSGDEFSDADSRTASLCNIINEGE